MKITTDKTKKLNSPNGNSTPADSTPILHKGPFIGRNTTTSKYGQSGSTITFNQMANTVAAGIANSMTSTELTAGTVKFEQINAVRFALRDPNDVQYDITNPGMTPLVFTTLETTGGVDGYYSIDAVGAGDTFLSALVYFYLKYGNIEEAIPYANKAAAIAVSNFGTYILTKEDVNEILC